MSFRILPQTEASRSSAPPFSGLSTRMNGVTLWVLGLEMCFQSSLTSVLLERTLLLPTVVDITPFTDTVKSKCCKPKINENGLKARRGMRGFNKD